MKLRFLNSIRAKPIGRCLQLGFLVFCAATSFDFAHAGVMELSATYGTRDSRIDENNYSKSESITGSFAWYFLELSAIEISYTRGRGTLSAKAEGEDAIKYITDAELYGVDLVITFANRESFLQPFVKGGAAWVKKKIYREQDDGRLSKVSGTDDFETVPSYGVGIKINLTQTFAIKASYDRWQSAPDSDSDLWDEAIRGGISWMF